MLNTLALHWQLQDIHYSLLAMFSFGLVGILLLVVGFKVFDWITPKIDIQKELAEKHNLAVAIVIASVILGLAAIAVASML